MAVVETKRSGVAIYVRPLKEGGHVMTEPKLVIGADVGVRNCALGFRDVGYANCNT